MIGYFDYHELRAATIAPNATQDDINRLGEWFNRYGEESWNGEYYDADGYRLFPVVEWDEENECGNIIGYEFR